VPRCKHCDSSGNYVWSGLREKRNGAGDVREIPAIRFRCGGPETPECLNVQEINPSRDWRRLVPIWRTHAPYIEMRTSHSQYERSHRQSRLRYRVAPNSYVLRPKRIGIGCQQLRATAALSPTGCTCPRCTAGLATASCSTAARTRRIRSAPRS
jgi:hypothetical protein